MPSFHCRHIGCQSLVERPGWCDDHAGDARVAEAERQKHYSQHRRDTAADKFYHSKSWISTRAQVLAQHPTCQRCGSAWSKHVHHIKPLDRCDDLERLDPRLLQSLCIACHNVVTGEEQRQPAPQPDRPHVSGMLTVAEDDTYRFDAEAADKVLRFVDRYIRYTTGAKVGQPFQLAPVQRQILRDVYGYKHRQTGLRRFKRVFWNGSVGCGKSPILAIAGLIELFIGSEPGNQIYVMASDYAQANRTIFEPAKQFIRAHPKLAKLVDIRQFWIRNRRTGTKWEIVSGKGPKAGAVAGVIIADECFQWRNDKTFNDLQSRTIKRPEPLTWVATNTATHRDGLYGQMQEHAEDVLAGKRSDPSLYPILWQAGPDDDIGDPAVWRKANPLIGVTITEQALREEWGRRKGLPSQEAEWRQLYLGQFVQPTSRWLDLGRWDACTSQVDPDAIKNATHFVGLDLSQGDDLCAAVSIFVTPDRWHVRSRFWLPRETADRYQRTEGHPYRQWSADCDIDLLPETTITPAVQARIAQAIIDLHKATPITAVAFDRYRADAVIAQLEAAGITCIPTAQGYTLNAGCVELERRLTEGSVVIESNAVLRSHAETVEVMTDARGNIWPVKPGRRGQFKGRPGSKIDGVAALCTAATEVQRRQVKPAPAAWSGEVLLV